MEFDSFADLSDYDISRMDLREIDTTPHKLIRPIMKGIATRIQMQDYVALKSNYIRRAMKLHRRWLERKLSA